MDYIGKYFGFEAYYLDLKKEDYKIVLPEKNWFCCAIANKSIDQSTNSLIELFIRFAINREILSWHGIGEFGDNLHFCFDNVMVKMEVDEGNTKIDICTDSDENIAEGFWACFGAPCLPAHTDYETVKLICLSFDGENYFNELKSLMFKFNEGWLPSS